MNYVIQLYLAYLATGIIYFLIMNSNNLMISEKYPGKITLIKYLNLF